MITSEKIPNRSETQSLPVATLREGKYYIGGVLSFELPPGSHRPEQMLLAELLEGIIPVGKIVAARVEHGTGEARFFSQHVDVIHEARLERLRSIVQAEYVILKEIFLSKDRSFNSKVGHHYPGRSLGVTGHNMDWVKGDTPETVRAIHYDFEQFYNFLKWMNELWISQRTPEQQSQIANLFQQRLEQYTSEFSSKDYIVHLKRLLTALRSRLTVGNIEKAISNVVAQQELPDPRELHVALYNKITFFEKCLDKLES